MLVNDSIHRVYSCLTHQRCIIMVVTNYCLKFHFFKTLPKQSIHNMIFRNMPRFRRAAVTQSGFKSQKLLMAMLNFMVVVYLGFIITYCRHYVLCEVVHKQVHWIRTNLQMLKATFAADVNISLHNGVYVGNLSSPCR